MNLLCIIDNCFSCFVIKNNYFCSGGFDDPDIDPRNCRYYAMKVKCPGGLVFRLGEYTEETCHNCMSTCASTGCPRYEKQKRVAPDEYNPDGKYFFRTQERGEPPHETGTKGLGFCGSG